MQRSESPNMSSVFTGFLSSGQVVTTTELDGASFSGFPRLLFWWHYIIPQDEILNIFEAECWALSHSSLPCATHKGSTNKPIGSFIFWLWITLNLLINKVRIVHQACQYLIVNSIGFFLKLGVNEPRLFLTWLCRLVVCYHKLLINIASVTLVNNLQLTN